VPSIRSGYGCSFLTRCFPYEESRSQPREGPPFGDPRGDWSPTPILHTWIVDSRGDLQTRIGGLDQQVALPILGRVLGGSLEARPSFGLFFFVGCASGVPWRVLCKVLWGSGYTLPERLEVGR
jgi:hypothetical protein